MKLPMWGIKTLLLILLFGFIHLNISSVFAQACGTGTCKIPPGTNWTACTDQGDGRVDACGRKQGKQFKYGKCQGGPIDGTGVMRLGNLELNFHVALPKFCAERSKAELRKIQAHNPWKTLYLPLTNSH